MEFTKKNKLVFATDTLKQNQDSYYVPLWNYKKGQYQWMMKYSYTHNGQSVEKASRGKVLLTK
jgi:hypothetical protein